MSVGRLVRAAARAIAHNWPLKVAAVVLATLIYVGLVAMQGSSSYPGPIPVQAVSVPPGTTVTNSLRPLDEIRYVAPADVGPLTADDFHATVDLSGLEPTGVPQSVRVSVTASDPRVAILEVRPRTVSVTLDQETSSAVPVDIVRGPAPSGIEVGDMAYAPQQVTVSGASAAVRRVAVVRVDVTLDPNGLDFDQEVQGTPVDASGAAVTGVTLNPRTVHVTIPLYRDRQSRSVPINPVLAGDPAPGFRVAGVEVSPLTVTLQGEAATLAGLSAADSAPVQIGGATRDVTQKVGFALPTGVTPVTDATVTVVVRIEAVTETRTLAAGIRLDGGSSDLSYALSAQSVLLTVFGSSADLDLLSSSPISVGIDVSGMAPGRHAVTVVPSLPSGVTLVSIMPSSVTLDISGPSSLPPGGQGGLATPSPGPG